ncbi:ferredoxin [Aestuariispira insulae]|uniref:4Fe-4S ferredoxin-type domain-containing protein n=1 Tax=Aestuariispira insulae TaxID=1461337 RepID=A0A3D9HP48_9PROT|nr:ferredoxin [Aestuariispira insulae]RED51257.1 hypothetical protein DFP90_10356 [Aestuariispira insulae]
MLDRLSRWLAPHGLILRGAFHAAPEDGLPGSVRTLVLIGTAGSAMWQPFDEVRTPHTHALDIWTRELIEKLADEVGAQVFFPFGGPPYHPFQRWAGRAEPGLEPSPVMISCHPDYGLWHAYRGALAFKEKLSLSTPPTISSPCVGCADKPCLTACPVQAFDGKSYDVAACSDHIRSDAGQDCRDRGCLARRACAVGQDHAYAPDHARFHMDAFIKARR